MPVFKMFKKDKLVNTIVADSVELTGEYWDRVEEVTPSTPAPIPEPPRTWNVNDVRSGMSFQEKINWDNDSAPEIITAKIEFSVPKEYGDTVEVLDYLVSTGDISEQTRNKILT